MTCFLHQKLGLETSAGFQCQTGQCATSMKEICTPEIACMCRDIC